MLSPAAPAQRRKGFRIAAFRPEFGLNPRPRRVAAPALLNACVAEKSARRVYGVNAVVNDLEIKLLGDGRCIDEDLAAAALGALSAKLSVEAPGPSDPGQPPAFAKPSGGVRSAVGQRESATPPYFKRQDHAWQ
jgi:hypothetical protein